MTFAARREGLPVNQGNLVRQAMLCMNHLIDPADWDDIRAFVKLSHSGFVLLELNQLGSRHTHPVLIDAVALCEVGTTYDFAEVIFQQDTSHQSLKHCHGIHS